MNDELLKTLIGHSGSIVTLMKNQQHVYVRKRGNIQRNLIQLKVLQDLNIEVPKILFENDEYYDMEYIPHQDIKTWLTRNNPHSLIYFITSTIHTFQQRSTLKDYTDIYYQKLSWLDQSTFSLPFNKHNLVERLPRFLPQSYYHGDLTLENILYSNRFILIDPLKSEYDSWVFDLSKLRQDLDSQWFIRNDSHNIHAKLENIILSLKQTYPREYFSPELLILMLLRVLPYCHNKDDQIWILKEIHKLWK